MPSSSAHLQTRCHLSHLPEGGKGRFKMAKAAIWVCQHPYRTLRMAGPSAECAGCPVWQELESERVRAERTAEEIRILERMIAS